MAVGFLCIGLLASVVLFLMREHPVIYAYRESGNPTGDAAWAVLNPFRDRAPEQVSESLLGSLQGGGGVTALKGVRNLPADKVSELAQREIEHQITGWKLISREDTQGSVRLLYRTARGTSSGMESPVWITVQFRQGKWELIDFNAWY
jgi:hypothetical protein